MIATASSLKPPKPGMLLHSGYSSIPMLLHSLEFGLALGGGLVSRITSSGHTNSIAVELCFDAFRISSCPGGFTIRISSRLINSRLKLMNQLSFLAKPAIDIPYTACDYPLCNSRVIEGLQKTISLLGHCEDFRMEFLNPKNLSSSRHCLDSNHIGQPFTTVRCWAFVPLDNSRTWSSA